MTADRRLRLQALDGLEAPELWSEIETRRPRSDAVEVRRTRGRAITGVVAVAVGIGSILMATSLMGPPERRLGSLDTSTWVSHRIDESHMHLAFRHPGEWHVQPFDETVGHIDFKGAVVSNITHAFRHPDLGPDTFTTLWDLSDLPSDSVVLSIEHSSGGPPITGGSAHTRWPLDLGKAYVAETPLPAPGWTQRWLPFVAGRDGSIVRTWFGPNASEHDREVARRIVASIAPIATAFDGWVVGVEVDPSTIGPLEISVGPIVAAEQNDARPWIQHSIVLHNTGSATLRFDDTEISSFLGLPEPELIAADEGCGYAQDSPTSRVMAGVCRLSLDSFAIPPYGTIRKTVTLFKGLTGMAPLTEGRYVFEKIYRFAVEGSDAKTTVEVRLVYDVRRAS